MLNVRSDESSVVETLIKFSNGEISRQRAMHVLDVDYSDLLDMMADHDLALPELSDEEAAFEGRRMAEFLDSMGV